MEDDDGTAAAEVTIPGVTNEAETDLDSGGIKILDDTDLSSDDSDSDSSSDEDGVKKSKEEKRKKRKQRKQTKEEREAALQAKWNAAPPLPQRGPVVFSQKWNTDDGNSVVLREFPGAESCKNSVIYQGFPSKGLSGVLVAKTLVDELDLPLVGELAAGGFTAACRIRHGVASHVSRIYGDSRLTVFVSELQVDSVTSHALTSAILLWAERRNSTLIISSEGLEEDLDLDLDEDEKQDQEAVVKKLIETMHLDDDGEDGEKKRREHAHKHHHRHVHGAGGGAGTGKGKEPSSSSGGGKKSSGAASIATSSAAAASAAAASLGSGNNQEEDANDDGWEDAEDDDNKDKDAVKKARHHSHKSASVPSKTLFIATHPEENTKLLALGCHRIKNAIVSGIAGLLLTESPFSSNGNIHVVLIVARYHPLLGDARAALAILDALSGLCDLSCKIKYSKLKSRAASLEFRVKKGLGKIAMKGAGTAPTNMYT